MNMVLCNSRTFLHLFAQFLVTDTASLVLATFDNLPRDEDEPILCLQAEMKGDFIAPEQKWPYEETKIFNLEEQPKYDHMADIWRVPEVASHIISACEEVMDYLQVYYEQCKAPDPQHRPTAAELLMEHESVWKLLYRDDVFL
jgi:glycoprotein-mannosyl O6-kinase